MDNTIQKMFTRRIDKSEEGLYLHIPFVVIADVESFTIAYSYTRHLMSDIGGGKTAREEINIVDLALEDPSHALVGASGSERSEITIHEDHATPGYSGTRINPGQWYLVLGAYCIQADGCPVEITITQHQKHGMLLSGDCHTHSVHSDGWYSVDEVIDRAMLSRLDYLFLTDHNSMASNAFIRSSPRLTVLPGVEVTYYNGHYNLFGLARPIRSFVANSREQVLAIMREGRANGALVSINHPRDGSCGWNYGLGEDVPNDMVEIWNGPFTPYNQMNIDLWHQQLCMGRKLPAIGGSDCHREHLFCVIGSPTTFLYARSRNGSDILDAMKKGHAFVGMEPEAPEIFMQMGQAEMGDTYTGGLPEPLRLAFRGIGNSDEIRIVDQTGIVFKSITGACARYEMEFVPTNSRFLRAEVWRTFPSIGETLASISNPVYIEQ
jgi:hypothetical protein